MRITKGGNISPKLAVALANVAIEYNMTVDELVKYMNRSKNRAKMQAEYVACKGLQGTGEMQIARMSNPIEDPWTGEEDTWGYHKETNPIEDPWTGECRSVRYTDTSKDPWECSDRHGDFLPGKRGIDPVRMVQIVVPLFIVAWVLIFIATLLKEFGIF